LDSDFETAAARLLSTANDHPLIRPYQRDANVAIEEAIVDRKRHLLVAMATGTGKTFTMVNQVYRLMRSGLAKRILFLVDRRALAAQAVRAFSSFDAEPGQKFDQIYEVYSSRFQMGDFSEDERFDPKVLPTRYLTDPQPGDAFVYVSTIQRMAINVLGRRAIFGAGDEAIEQDAEKLDIPIHAFDVIIADECHRGYTASEVSDWRDTLNHFDAIKIGLTATPAAHTTAYFNNKVFEYRYEEAVRDGYLVDYDAVKVHSDVRMNGVFLREGEHVEVIDPETGLSRADQMEDERQFETSDLESRITAPRSNRLILEEVKRYADEHEKRYGRFPKTLIFAVNDLPHTSHADQLTDLARDVFSRGEHFVAKITGRVDRPLQRIREFRNRPSPSVAVTVDLLSTGVDIPDLEFIVLLRPIKSRILFEQVIGRGTRKGERFTDKSHFTVFDCFDGTLLDYFKGVTGITAEMPEKPTRTVAEVIEEIWDNRDRDYNVGCLVKRLLRIDKEMSGDARDLFAAYIRDGDVAAYARGLRANLSRDFVGTMKLLRDTEFQRLLVAYPRPPRERFMRAVEYEDAVSSSWLIRDEQGREFRPDDYLQTFAQFVRDNATRVEAIGILLDRPQGWSAGALAELRRKLIQTPQRFTTENLEKAHRSQYHKSLIDIISMVKHAARDEEPLLTSRERVDRAFASLTSARSFSAEQEQWLGRIRDVMIQNLSLDQQDFDNQPALSDGGGLSAARRVFGGPALNDLIQRLNEAIAA
jgi:type I restriction enzyme R subunit